MNVTVRADDDLTARDRVTPSPSSRSSGHVAAVDHEVVIIGAGFSGLGSAIQLRRMGIDDLVILDREEDLGGTWHVNRYPGIAVDIASATYSFSFLPNPGWSRLYAPGAELKAYADHVADTYDLRRHLRFGCAVEEVVWEEDATRWRVAIGGRDPLTCRTLVIGTGFLSQPKRPDIPGLDRFRGTTVHTAGWPGDLDVAGLRVGVIGTGATAVQLVPEIAGTAATVEVFQRTPIWVVPKVDAPVPRGVRALFKHIPPVQKAIRLGNNTLLELLGAGVLYHRRFPAVIAAAELLARAHLRAQVRDAATRAALTPDYDLFCKRPTFSNDYLRSFNRDDVHLVTDAIDAVTETGIRTADGIDHALDVLVLATGFAVQEAGNFPPFPVRGPGGHELGTQWRQERFTSYEGITIAGYPNLLYLPSPYAFSGLSFFFTIENQMAHMDRLLSEVRDRGAQRFEVTQDAQDGFMRRMDSASPNTIWAAGGCGGANSYYFNEHGDTSLARLSPTVDAMVRHRRFSLDDYAYG